MSLGGLEERCCRRSPPHHPLRGGSGSLILSLVCLLAHRSHSHLVAPDRICKAMLITIVTRALFLAGSVPPAVWQSGAVSSLGSAEQGWPWWLLEDVLVLPPFSLLCHHAHLACHLLASLLASLHYLSFSPPRYPQRTQRAHGPVLAEPKSCSKEALYIQGENWEFGGSNCLFSSIWGALWWLHSTNARGRWSWADFCSNHRLFLLESDVLEFPQAVCIYKDAH